MTAKWNQLVINFTSESLVAEEFDQTFRKLGFNSRGSYVMFLHLSFKEALKLNEKEKRIIRYLGKKRGTAHLGEIFDLFHVEYSKPSVVLKDALQEIKRITDGLCTLNIIESIPRKEERGIVEYFALTRKGKIALQTIRMNVKI